MILSEDVTFDFPYQQQYDALNERVCGAACLSMVYRSFEKEIPQEKIWPAIARKNRFGSLAAATHLMAKDAMDRGFKASAIQTSSPIEALKNARQVGLRVILNHLMEPNNPAGHYSVLVDINDRDVFLHDPFFGPGRRLSHREFLELWRPQTFECEISGFVLVCITQPPATSDIAAKAECPGCRCTVAVAPAVLFPKANICPACDRTWLAGAPAEPRVEKFDLSKVFGALDRFTDLVGSTPGAVDRPEIREQLDALALQKDKIRSAIAAFEESQKQRTLLLAKIEASAKQAKEAHEKKVESSRQPFEHPDPQALGHALLESLGLKAKVKAQAR